MLPFFDVLSHSLVYIRIGFHFCTKLFDFRIRDDIGECFCC